MASIRFFVNKGKSSSATIQCQVDCVSGRKSFSTKMKVPREYWDQKRQTISGARISDDLIKTRNKLEEWRDMTLSDLDQICVGLSIDEVIKKFYLNEQVDNGVQAITVEGLIKHRMDQSRGMSNSLYGLLGSVYQSVSRYSNHIGLSESRISEVNQYWLNGFVEFLRESEGKKSETINAYSASVCYSISLAKKALRFKKDLSQEENDLLGVVFDRADSLKSVGSKTEKHEKEYLSLKEIETIYSLRNNLNGNDLMALDCYICSFFTGLRFSELAERTEHDIFSKIHIDGEKYSYMRYDSRKNSSKNIYTAFHPFLEQIMSEYEEDSRVISITTVDNGVKKKNRFEIKKPIFPRLKYSTAIIALQRSFKFIAEKHPDQAEFLSKEIKVSSESGIKYCKRYELLTFHTARHGFGAFMLQSGYSIQQVSKLLGHKSVKTTEEWYQHLDFEQSALMAAKMFRERSSLNKKGEDTTPPTKQKKIV